MPAPGAGLGCSGLASASKTILTPLRFRRELVHEVERDLNHWLKHQLGNSIAWLHDIGLVAIVCQDDSYFPMIVRVNHANSLCHANSVLK